MPIRAVHTTVPAPSGGVFNYLADIENLPRWAGGFCEWLELHAGGWRAYTVLGELGVEIVAGDRLGEFELRFASSADGVLPVWFRVRTDGEAGAVVSFGCRDDARWDERRRAELVDALVDALRGLAGRLPAERHPPVAELVGS